MLRYFRLFALTACVLALFPPVGAKSDNLSSGVVISSPAPGQKLSGVVDLSVSTDTDLGSVEFFLDGVSLAPRVARRPYTLSFNASAYPSGFYTLSAVARDASGAVTASPAITVFVQGTTAAAAIPSGHPRLLLINGRLEELRRLACYDDQGNAIPGCTRTPQAQVFMDFINNTPQKAETWHFALAYMITGDPSYADTAIQKADEMVACDWQCIASSHNHFLTARDFMRSVALVYDWLYDRLTPAQRSAYISYMNKIMFLVWNDTDEANAIYDTSDWATSSPTNNFYYAYLAGTTYVALSTYGENPGTFVHDGVTHNAYYLMNSRDPSSDRYTDLYEFLFAKMNEQMWPSLAKYGKGGGWLEGENYGQASKRHLCEVLLLLKQTAGIDLMNNPAYPFPRQAFYYELYSVQPGNKLNYPGGDQTTNPTAPVRAYHRHFMLMIAEGMRGTVESEYAQYWCNNVLLNMEGTSIMKPNDFILYRPTAPQRDFRELPPYYIAEGAGWVHSRSDWSDDATAVTMVSADRVEGHVHRDQNSFVIYRGGNSSGVQGWLLTDVGPFSDDTPDYTWAHNTMLIADTQQRYGAGTGKIAKFDPQADYVYAVGDASDAYYTNPGAYGTGDDKMVDVFQRELVHILPGYVVVFDRVVLSSGHTGSAVENLFHVPYNQPAVVNGAIQETLGINRMYQKVLLPQNPVGTWVDETANGFDTWKYVVKDSASRPNYQFLNVFQVTNNTVNAMTPTERIVSEDGAMVGAVIKDPVQHRVVMFSADPAGATPPGSIIYEVGLRSPGVHQLCDLVPGAGYDVSMTLAADGCRVTVRPGGERMTTAAGVLSFHTDEVARMAFPVARQ